MQKKSIITISANNLKQVVGGFAEEKIFFTGILFGAAIATSVTANFHSLLSNWENRKLKKQLTATQKQLIEQLKAGNSIAEYQ